MRPRYVTVLLLSAVIAAGCSGPRPGGIRLLEVGPPTVEELDSIFVSAGFTTRIFDQRSLALSTPEGYHVIVFLEDEGASLQALFPCVRPGSVPVGAVAGWNATRRFSRAYLDADGRPVMAADMVLDEATTRGQIAAWGEMLLALADVFMAEVWPPLPAAAASPEPGNE